MGIMSHIVAVAAGLGMGYYVCKNEPCPKGPAQRIAALEEKYHSLPGQQGIVGPQDVSIDYVVDEKHGFKGYMFMDNSTGHQGVLVRSTLFGKGSYYLSYAGLEGDSATVTERVPLLNRSNLPLPVASEQESNQIAVSRLWRKFRSTVDDLVE